MTFMQNSITSFDGVIISYSTIGKGAGLVIIPGTFRVADNYKQLAQALSDTFTVHIMERRGRGESGEQGENYSLDTEVQDVQALLKETKASLLFGHSYGGLVGLEVALHERSLEKLAVYEPAVSVDDYIPATFVPDLRAALARKDYARALNALLKTTGETPIPENQLDTFADSMAASPEWAAMCELLITTPAEIAVTAAADGTYPKYHSATTDTLLMYGSESGPIEKRIASLLAQTLPHGTVSEISGVSHNAPDEQVPEKIAEKLKVFYQS